MSFKLVWISQPYFMYQRTVNDNSSPNVVYPDRTANVVQLDQGLRHLSTFVTNGLIWTYFFKIDKYKHWACLYFKPMNAASLAQLDAPSNWRPGGRGFNPRRGWQHSFVEIDHEIFSTVILSLSLIQEGQLSVSCERMCTILVNCLED